MLVLEHQEWDMCSVLMGFQGYSWGFGIPRTPPKGYAYYEGLWTSNKIQQPPLQGFINWSDGFMVIGPITLGQSELLHFHRGIGQKTGKQTRGGECQNVRWRSFRDWNFQTICHLQEPGQLGGSGKLMTLPAWLGTRSSLKAWNQTTSNLMEPYGGFLNRGVPKWMVCNEKNH